MRECASCSRHYSGLHFNESVRPVFAVITTVVKYVRTVLHQTGHFARHNSTKLRCQYARYCNKCTIQMINLKGQDIAKTFHHEREPMSWHTSSNLFDRFDLYIYVDIYYGMYERYATVQLLPRYQRYQRLYWLRTNGTDPPVPLRWSVYEHCVRQSCDDKMWSYLEGIVCLGSMDFYSRERGIACAK
jgi:hypothetical protein